MNSASQIEELQETLLETIKTKDPKLAKRFVVLLANNDERDKKDILHSIELLAMEMSANRKESNTHFEALQKEMNIRFESIQQEMSSNRKETNTRFEALQKIMDIRFEAIDKRFNQQNWLIGMMFTLLAILMTILNYIAL